MSTETAPCSTRGVAAAARRVLEAGGVVAFATESSYGLGVDPRSEAGVEAIFRLKGRERGKALPVVAANVEQLLALGVDAGCEALAWARPRWPAALSVLLPLARPLPATAGLRTVAARIPARPPLVALLAALGTALTATSANPTGAEPMTDPAALARWLAETGETVHLVDEGRAPGGPPSTLVEIVQGSTRVLRKGRVIVDD